MHCQQNLLQLLVLEKIVFFVIYNAPNKKFSLTFFIIHLFSFPLKIIVNQRRKLHKRCRNKLFIIRNQMILKIDFFLQRISSQAIYLLRRSTTGISVNFSRELLFFVRHNNLFRKKILWCGSKALINALMSRRSNDSVSLLL